MDQTFCPNCHLPVLTSFYFCPNCGKELRAKPLQITIGKQIGVYLLSFLIPPLGLWPGIKYLKQADPKAKRVGVVAILLTIVSIVITIVFFVGFMNQVSQQLNSQLMLNQLQ